MRVKSALTSRLTAICTPSAPLAWLEIFHQYMVFSTIVYLCLTTNECYYDPKNWFENHREKTAFFLFRHGI